MENSVTTSQQKRQALRSRAWSVTTRVEFSDRGSSAYRRPFGFTAICATGCRTNCAKFRLLPHPVQPKSKAGAECVMAPMLIRSTPVSAAAADCREVNAAGGFQFDGRVELVPQRHGRPELVGRHVVEKNNVRAGGKTSASCSSVSTSTSTIGGEGIGDSGFGIGCRSCSM